MDHRVQYLQQHNKTEFQAKRNQNGETEDPQKRSVHRRFLWLRVMLFLALLIVLLLSALLAWQVTRASEYKVGRFFRLCSAYSASLLRLFECYTRGPILCCF